MSDQRYTDALLANGRLREERDRLREALKEILAYSLENDPAREIAEAALAKEAGK